MGALSQVTSGLSSLVGLIAGVLVLAVLLVVVGVFVVIVVANRADSDPSGRRPIVVYLFGVAFVTIWTALIGSVAVVSSFFQLIGSYPGYSVGDTVARDAVLGGLIMLVSVAALFSHLRKGLALAKTGEELTSPAKRIAQSYVSAVAFVSVVVVIVALVAAVYSVFQIGGPGVFGGGGRIPTLRHLLDALYVVGAAGLILSSHLNLATPLLWRRTSE